MEVRKFESLSLGVGGRRGSLSEVSAPHARMPVDNVFTDRHRP